MQFKIKDSPGYTYDPQMGVVINRNDRDLQSYRNQVDSANRTKEVERKFDSLQNELEVIKRQLGIKG